MQAERISEREGVAPDVSGIIDERNHLPGGHPYGHLDFGIEIVAHTGGRPRAEEKVRAADVSSVGVEQQRHVR